MSERQRPKSKVRGGVRNAAECELDRVDGLVHEGVTEAELKTKQMRSRGNLLERWEMDAT